MPLLLTLAIIVVALVILVLLYLTFVPIVASFSAAACLIVAELVWGLIGLRARIDPTEGIGRLEIRIAGLPITVPRPKRAVLQPPREVVSKAIAPEAQVKTVLEAAGVLLRALPEIMRFLVAVLRQTGVRLRLGLIFGTGDAATTGETFGALMALRGAVSGQPWLSLAVTPVFDGPVFDWHAAGEARIRSPIRVLVPGLRLFLRVRSLMQENGARS